MNIYVSKLWKAIMVLSITIIFSLGVTNRSFAQEMCLLDQTYTMTVNEHGFHYFPVDSSFSDNWVEPFNYYEGSFYIKYEILDYPSTKPFGLSLGVWSDVKRKADGKVESWKESCSPQLLISGRGVFNNISSPKSWWKKDSPVDFTHVRNFESFFIVYWCSDFLNLSDWVSKDESCWTENELLLPMKMHVTIVAVAKGYEFSGWK